MNMKLDKQDLFRIITEELSKSEVSGMINNKVDSIYNSREFKKEVKNIAADVVNELFKILWQRNSVWKSSVVQ